MKHLFNKKYKNKIILNVVLAVSSIVFTLTIIEIVFRATHLLSARISFSTPDPVLGYRFVASKKYWNNKETKHPIKGRLNRFGWRDKEWALKKTKGVFRIAVIGDSFVEAFQVEENKTFLRIAENNLTEYFHADFEVMNFGRSGYTQSEELLVLKNEVLQFSPDMVILFFSPINDIADIDKKTAPNNSRPFFIEINNNDICLDTSFSETRGFKVRMFISYFKNRSALISLLCERYNAFKIKKAREKLSGSLDHENQSLKVSLASYLSLCTDDPDDNFSANYDLNKVLMKKMYEICRAREIRFMLVTINTGLYISEIENKFRSITGKLNPNYFEDDLGKFASSLGIGYIGLQRLFHDYYKKNDTILHRGDRSIIGHWNYEGHKIVASALTKKIMTILTNESKQDTNPLLMTPHPAADKEM